MQSMRFEAMGTDCHIVVIGGSEPSLPAARARIEQLEARWSRFRPESELCALNAARGRAVRVSPDTMLAVTTAVDAWYLLNGVFDPSIVAALERAGYDRTFSELLSEPPRPPEPDPASDHLAIVPGCAGIVIDRVVRAITLPAHVRLDLGGIGKGLAADLVAAEVMATGADGVLVNIGGDLRCMGTCPHPTGWTVVLEHLPGCTLALAVGGLATSAITKRRWRHGTGTAHHVIDPATGLPAKHSAASATVIATRAVDAETLATAALLAGPDAGVELLSAHGASGVLVGRDGERHATAELTELVA